MKLQINLFELMGSICDAQPGAPSLFSGATVSGIIFNDSDFDVEYDISSTKSKVINEKVTKNVSGSASVSANIANPTGIGGNVKAAADEHNERQIQEEETQATVYVKPHRYSTQGLLNLPLSKQQFISLSYWNDDQDVEHHIQANILITCRESVCFIITKDLGCQSLTEAEVQFYKKQFKNDLDARKIFRPELRNRQMQGIAQ